MDFLDDLYQDGGLSRYTSAVAHAGGRWTLKRGDEHRSVVAFYDGQPRSVHYDVPWAAYALGKLLARLNAAPAPDDTTGDTPMTNDDEPVGIRRTLSEWARREGIAILDGDVIRRDGPITRAEFLACADQCTVRHLLLKDVMPAEYARDIEWVLDGNTITPKGRDLIVQAIIRAVAGMECDREAEARASRSAATASATLPPGAVARGGGNCDTFGVGRAAVAGGGGGGGHTITSYRLAPAPAMDVHERDRRILTELLQSTPPGMNVVSYMSGAARALGLTQEGEAT